MKRLKFLICPIAAFAALASSSAAMAAPLYPDLETLPPRALRFDRVDVGGGDTGHSGTQNVLRFSNTVTNSGEGPLVMAAHLDSATKRGQAIQRIYDADGTYTNQPTGSDMYFHPSHNHYHFDGWGQYQLWTASEYQTWLDGGSTGPEATGSKTTSCILDEEFIQQRSGSKWPGTYNFGGCNPDAQGNLLEGLSVGWGDTYDYWRADQWIELGTNGTLADGDYVLRSVTDPGNVVDESPGGSDDSRESRTANDGVTRFSVVGGRIVDNLAPTGTVMINNVDASATSSRVTVKVLGRDDVAGVDQFRVSNDGNTWATYQYQGQDSTPSQISWDLNDSRYGGVAGGGTKTVHVQFHDASGRWGQTERDTITLEGAPPVSAYAQSVLADTPVSFWRLSETSGTAAADVRQQNPGAYVNSPTLGGSSLIDTDPDNHSVGFNGSSNFMRAPDSASLDLASAITVEAWIKPSSLPAAGGFASIVTKPEAYSLQFNGPRMEFTVMQAGVRKRMQAPAGAIQPGGTYHVVGTYDGTTQRLYLNGVEVASGPLTGAATATNTALFVGSWDGGAEYFNGVIDDAALYGKTLTAARVKAHYDAGRGQQAPPPAAPSNLAGTAASDTKVDLTWNDNSPDESSFILERSTNPDFTAPVSTTIANDESKHSDTGLTASTQYWYRLRARNAVGYSTYSNVATVTTKASPTTPPSAYASAVAADTPVSWWRLGEGSGPNAADERGANPGFYTGTPAYGSASLLAGDTANKAVGFNGDDSVGATDSASLDLTSAITLEAWIRPNLLPAAGDFASIVSKPESYSLQFNGPVLELTVIQNGARRRLQAPAGAIQTGQTYHVVGTYDGTTQRLYVNGTQVASTALSGAATVTPSNLSVGSWNGSSELFDGVIDEPAVYGSALGAARVAAHYDAGRGSTTPPPPTPPAAPTGLGATAASDTRVDLSWTDNSNDETGFVVERSTSSSFATAQAIELGAGVRTYSDTGRSPNTTYWYRVKAVNGTGPSDWSNATSATTQQTPPPPPTAPAAPSSLTAAAASDTRVDLAWADNSSNETGFVVERSTSSSFATVQSTPLGENARSWSDTGRSASTTYWYRVRAVNAAGQSGWSNSASATTQAAPVTYTSTVTADAPVAWWRLGETSGTTAVDQRGAANGTYRGSPARGTASLLATDAANRSVLFDGANDAVQVTDRSALDLTNRITLEAWIRPNVFLSNGRNQAIISKSSAYALQLAGSRLDFSIYQNGVRRQLLAPSGAVRTGTTYHVVATFDGSTQRLYVNGAQVASRSQSGSATSGAGSLGVGARGGVSEWFTGTIDEPAVYNTALTAARVAAHHSAGRGSASVAAQAKKPKKPRLRGGRTHDRQRDKARRRGRGRR